MGMDQQGIGALKQGMHMAGQLVDLVNGSDADDTAADLARANAGLAEQDARASAHDQQQAARQQAAAFREKAEQERAGQHAEWGASNLAMSGSKRLVHDSARLKDNQAEQDILFQGDQAARDTLNQGRNRANLLRINGGASADGSTLALGSKLYKYGG